MALIVYCLNLLEVMIDESISGIKNSDDEPKTLVPNATITQAEKENIVRNFLKEKVKQLVKTKVLQSLKMAGDKKQFLDISNKKNFPKVLVNSDGERVFSVPPPSMESYRKVQNFVQFNNSTTLILNVLRYEAGEIENKKFEQNLLMKEVDREQHLLHNCFMYLKEQNYFKEYSRMHAKEFERGGVHRHSSPFADVFINPGIAYRDALNNGLFSNLQHQRLFHISCTNKNLPRGEPSVVFSTTTSFQDHLPPPPSVTPERHKRFPYSDYSRIFRTQLDRSLYPQFLPSTFSPSSPDAQHAQIAFNRSLLPQDLDDENVDNYLFVIFIFLFILYINLFSFITF